MKMLHISDLHIGKRLKEFSMLEDQEYILLEILKIVDAEHPDCIIIAGDIYDKTIPQAEAVQVFDNFLYALAERKLYTLLISGNHDSPERVSFGGRLMESNRVYIAPVFHGKIPPITLCDALGEVHFYLLPYVKPAHVRRYYPDAKVESYHDAIRTIINDMDLDRNARNVLVTHQFVTGSVLSNSEEFFVGGTENVDADLFDAFDYTALGHIHRPQNVGTPKIRYSGSQLKYHFDEIGQEKTVTIAEIGVKGELHIREIPLQPKRQVRAYKGTYTQITSKSFYDNIEKEDYVYITLTDEEDIPDAARKLKKIYPNMLQLFYDNCRTRMPSVIHSEIRNETLSPMQIFSEFYANQSNHTMTEEQQAIMEQVIKSVWEEESR